MDKDIIAQVGGTNVDRRMVMRAMGVGVAGLALASTPLAALAQSTAAAKPAARKFIVRADDIGHSIVCNIGTFEAIENGVVTAADVMLADPGTEDALERFRAYPWLSVGWHQHMWGAPVLGASRVPSLVEKGGEFDGRFRTDVLTSGDVVFEEALAECRAQIERCLRILGKVPDTAGTTKASSPFRSALKQVIEEYGIAHDYYWQAASSKPYMDHVQKAQAAGEEWSKYYSPTPMPAVKPDDRWADRKITTAAGTEAYIDLLTDSISSVEANYDPVKFFTEDQAGILKAPTDTIFWQAWHPGYVDYYIYRLGERYPRARAQQFVIGRTQDVAAMTSPVVKAWIKTNIIELINFRDALYGTADYQNHLKSIGSDLAVAS